MKVSPGTYGLLGRSAVWLWTVWIPARLGRCVYCCGSVRSSSDGHLDPEQKRLGRARSWADVETEPSGGWLWKRYTIMPEGEAALRAGPSTSPQELALLHRGAPRLLFRRRWNYRRPGFVDGGDGHGSASDVRGGLRVSVDEYLADWWGSVADVRAGGWWPGGAHRVPDCSVPPTLPQRAAHVVSAAGYRRHLTPAGGG